jgi:hypothetical protein
MAVRENTHNGREPGGGGEAPGGGHGAAGARNARRLHAGLGGIGRPGERGRGARRPPPSQQAGERASERRGLGTLCHSSAEQKSMRGRHGGRLLASRTGGGRPRARATPVATETHLSLFRPAEPRSLHQPPLTLPPTPRYAFAAPTHTNTLNSKTPTLVRRL